MISNMSPSEPQSLIPSQCTLCNSSSSESRPISGSDIESQVSRLSVSGSETSEQSELSELRTMTFL
jgi:hypothetical protein